MAKSFDRLARSYDWLEHFAFGTTLKRARNAFLDVLSSRRNVLILGEGDGRFLEALLRLNQHCRVDCVEQSPKMIARARIRLPPERLARVRFIQADATRLSLPASHYDAVVTLFFLDCCNEHALQRLVPRLSTSLKADGLWYLVDFQIPPSGWHNVHARAWLWLLYRFFRLTTDIAAQHWTDPTPYLMQEGFRLRHEKTFRFGLIASRLYKKVS